MVKKIKGEIEYDEITANILGKGAFGTVYRGRCSCSDHGGIIAVKKVAVNHPREELMEDVLQKLEHDNIVRLFHTFTDDDHRFEISL